MRIGVVGAGKIGSMRVQTVKENSETELAAVLDINPALAEQAVAGTSAPALTELNASLELQMDAVVVSTPPHLHEDACIGAFEQDRHVLCEKPLSNSVAACRCIVDAAIARTRS